jgi:chemotaxis protein methyltransferase WspC
MSRIEQLLRERVGLDPATLGATTIQRAVRLSMNRLSLKSSVEYEHLLQASPAQWAELVESVLVTETWFFRDPDAMQALVRLVLEEWLPTHPSPLRLLSVPCSSGEEPYSLVMALLDAGVPPDRFHIDAADISLRALARARKGLYPKNAFRGKDIDFRRRHFHPAKDGFVLDPSIRRLVHFIRGNLLANDFLAGVQSYDFIFCRNLLIYFDLPNQQLALERVSQLLAPTGVLFVGPAEQRLALDCGFVSANLPMAFACRKAGAPAPPPSLHRPARSAKWQPFPPPVLAGADFPNWLSNREASPAAGSLPRTPDLEQARRLADSGHLNEAAAICEAHLRYNRCSASAYYLLGLVRDAGGDATAADCYRKALYLEPNHYESLLQMALLAQKNGDAAAARNFRRRAQRLKVSTS